MRLSQLVVAVRKSIGGVGNDALLTRAAAIAFYSALSFAPLIVLLLWLLAALRPEWQQQLIEGLAGILGEKAAGAIDLVMQNAKSTPELGNLAGIIGALITLFSASVVFAQLQRALNVIWDVRAKPGKAVTAWLWARARAIGLLVGILFLLIVSFVVSTLIRIFVPVDSLAWNIAEQLISLLVFVVAFGAMYHLLPDARIAWSDAWHGAVLTTVLFVAGKYARQGNGQGCRTSPVASCTCGCMATRCSMPAAIRMRRWMIGPPASAPGWAAGSPAMPRTGSALMRRRRASRVTCIATSTTTSR